VGSHEFSLVKTVHGQVKVKLSLCLTEHHAMEVYWGVEVLIHAFLTSALDGRDWSVSRPDIQGKSSCYPWDRRLGGPQCRSVRGGERENSQPLPAVEPPIIQPVAQYYTTEIFQLPGSKGQVVIRPSLKVRGREPSHSECRNEEPG